ncbi:MAG: hypothetical protein J6T52_04465 [Bacteroidaceae bacterium]|nr:hypothetical protein [Bacteroidaceae bacterium]
MAFLTTHCSFLTKKKKRYSVTEPQKHTKVFDVLRGMMWGHVLLRNFIKDFKDLKGFGALRLKLYLELSFRILKNILRFNFKFHFELEATK